MICRDELSNMADLQQNRNQKNPTILKYIIYHVRDFIYLQRWFKWLIIHFHTQGINYSYTLDCQIITFLCKIQDVPPKITKNHIFYHYKYDVMNLKLMYPQDPPWWLSFCCGITSGYELACYLLIYTIRTLSKGHFLRDLSWFWISLWTRDL